MLNVLSKTGLGGVSANKGGIAVSFKFSDTTICFVSAHLAAGLSNIEERHQNYKALLRGSSFRKIDAFKTMTLLFGWVISITELI